MSHVLELARGKPQHRRLQPTLTRSTNALIRSLISFTRHHYPGERLRPSDSIRGIGLERRTLDDKDNLCDSLHASKPLLHR